MRLRAEQLDNALQQSLSPLYLVHGEAVLLVEEAADSIRQAARLAGASEREVWHVEGRFDWSRINWQGQSLSLFSSRRLIEIRLPSGSPGKEGGEALRALAAAPPADTTVLIISGKIDAKSQKSRWFSDIDAVGVTVALWPIDAAQLPGWILQRMRHRGLQADQSLATLIAERVEGNLFAAAQEIDKLELLSQDGQLDAKTILESVADNARFEAFGLVDMVLSGQAGRVPRVIGRLRAEGVDILAVFSAVSWSLRRLVDMASQLESGQRLEQVFASQKPPVWDKNKPVMRTALQRHGAARWLQFLQQMADIDRAAKGVSRDCPWRLLERLCLQVAGASPGRD